MKRDVYTKIAYAVAAVAIAVFLASTIWVLSTTSKDEARLHKAVPTERYMKHHNVTPAHPADMRPHDGRHIGHPDRCPMHVSPSPERPTSCPAVPGDAPRRHRPHVNAPEHHRGPAPMAPGEGRPDDRRPHRRAAACPAPDCPMTAPDAPAPKAEAPAPARRAAAPAPKAATNAPAPKATPDTPAPAPEAAPRQTK